MTFKEKLQKEHPEYIGDYCGGCFGCPSAYDYENKDGGLCKGVPYSPSMCTACWNRTIPGTEPRLKHVALKIGAMNIKPGISWPPLDREESYVEYCSADVRATMLLNAVRPKINMPGIKQVIFNDPATIVIWADGEKTVVKCQNGEPYDPEKGLAMAISKRALGNKHEYYNTFKHWLKKYKKRAKSIWAYKRDSEHCLHHFKCGVCGHAVAIPFSKDIIVPPEVCPSCGSKNSEVL